MTMLASVTLMQSFLGCLAKERESVLHDTQVERTPHSSHGIKRRKR